MDATVLILGIYPCFEEYVHEEAAVDMDPGESKFELSNSAIEGKRGEKYCGQRIKDQTV